MSMRAARLYDKNDLRVEAHSVPEIGDGEVLLRTRAATVCGTDIRMLKNGHAFASPAAPLVIGHELAGVVEKLGGGVSGFHVGQRVCVAPNYNPVSTPLTIAGLGHLDPGYRAIGIHEDGAFAEFVRIPRDAVTQGNVFPLPDSVSFAAAALVEPLACVFNAYEKARTGPGDHVLIIGAGPIGVMHAKISRMAGAGKVIVNDINPERLEMAKKLVPDIIPIGGDVELRSEIMTLTGGTGADVVITACPVPEVQPMAIMLAAVEGRVIFFGGLPKDRSVVPLDTNVMHYRQLTVTGTTRQSLRQFKTTLDLIADGVIQVENLITSKHSIDEAETAIHNAAQATGLKSLVEFPA
jgi:L-iditol 2-dehydrogenase